MTSVWPWILTVALTANLIVAGWVAHSHRAKQEDQQVAKEQLQLFEDAIANIQLHYVDRERVETKDLVEASLEGMLHDLDPYSQYMTPSDYQEMKVESRGEFGGLGIHIGMREDQLTVISPIEGTPAFEAGVLPGDMILGIDDTSTDGLGVSDAVELLRGEVETGTKLTLRSVGEKESRDVKIVRKIIKLPTIQDARIVTNGLATLRMTQFSDPTAKDLEVALESLQKQGMRGLVFDLRSNPGGLLDAAVDVCDLFLGSEKMIVYTRGRDTADAQSYVATDRTPYADLPVVLLVDNGSASASEIVAGAFQDHGRARLVGVKTFGKGSVQRIIPVGDHRKDGPALRLTVAKYYTESGRVIHGKGIEPDLTIPLEPAQRRDLLLHRSDPSRFKAPPDDPQLTAALEELAKLISPGPVTQAPTNEPTP